MRNVMRYSAGAAIMAAGMVLSSLLISHFFVRVKHEKEISVKGYAEATVVSDIGQVRVTLRAQAERRDSAYRLLRQVAEAVEGRARKSAPPDLQVKLDNPDFEAVYRRHARPSAASEMAIPASENADFNGAGVRDEGGKATDEVDRYVGRQDLALVSSDVRWIERTSAELNELIGEGYDITVHSPSFLVSDLGPVKAKLLEEATADGYGRAQVLARNSGARVGALCAARQGIFQITEPNSTSTSSYGEYDTSTVTKCVKAVVSLEYAVE